MFVKRITDVTVARLRTVLHALVSHKALRARRETSGLLNEAPRSSHRLFQVLVSVAVFPLVLVAMLVGSGTPAHAGPNGQQVYFQGNGPGCAGVIGTSEKIDHVIVSGTNPDNRQVEWQGSPSDGRTAWVAGWWWFGAVHVAYHGSESGWHDIYAYVKGTIRGMPLTGNQGWIPFGSPAGEALFTCTGTGSTWAPFTEIPLVSISGETPTGHMNVSTCSQAMITPTSIVMVRCGGLIAFTVRGLGLQ